MTAVGAVEPGTLILDHSEWENGARFVGFQHPEVPIMWRLALHPHPDPSGWALLDLRGRPYPRVLESGVLSARETGGLIRHADSATVRRRAARAMDRALARGDMA